MRMFSLQEFVKDCGSFTTRLVDDLLDKMTGNDHSKAIYQIRQVPENISYKQRFGFKRSQLKPLVSDDLYFFRFALERSESEGYLC